MMSSLQNPARVYQTPEWETPLTKPKRSALSRLKADLPFGRSDDDLFAKEASLERLPTHTSSIELGLSKPKPGFLGALAAKLDRFLPPHKKYLGLSRKRFLLFVVLPLAVLLLLILPIALGVGLAKKKPSSLPLEGNVWTGDLTYYDPGLGACGWVSAAGENVVAISHIVFDQLQGGGSDPNQNQACGKRIRIQRDFVEEGKGRRTVDVVVVDRCVGCEATDLDVSLGVFEQLAREEDGRVTANWAWLDSFEPV